MINLTMDIAHDVKNQLVDELIAKGYQVDPADGMSELAVKLLTLSTLNPPPAVRSIVFPRGFSVPQELEPGLRGFVAHSRDGKPLTPFLSKKAIKEGSRDAMLYDWGFHHFHLGTIDGEGDVDRTKLDGRLLFGIVRSDAIYAVAVRGHDWVDRELIEIVHDNWPHLIAQFRYTAAGSRQLSSADVSALRSNYTNYVLEVRPGVCYYSPGGGTMGNGGSAQAYMRVMHLNRTVQALERDVRERISVRDEGGNVTIRAYIQPPNILRAVDHEGVLVAFAYI